MKYYAIKRPDGTWANLEAVDSIVGAWAKAAVQCPSLFVMCAKGIRDGLYSDYAESAGYRCVEVCGFEEVKA